MDKNNKNHVKIDKITKNQPLTADFFVIIFLYIN